jgi:hypothetical protein
MTKRGRIVFGVIGYGLVGLIFLSFILRALWHVKSGQDWGYSNYKNQPMTYLGALASIAVGALAALVGLGYRLKRKMENRRGGQAMKGTE